MTKPTLYSMALLLSLAAACKEAPKEAPQEQPAAKPEIPNEKPRQDLKGHVRVAVSVDWEGAFLSEEGLEAMAEFRSAHPNVPLTHLICPGYYTNPGTKAKEEITKTIRSAIRPGDEVGLHIHAWKSLVTAAGVKPRLDRSFLSKELLDPGNGDVGFEIELDAYEPAELTKIVKTSKQLLTDAGFSVGKVFRSSGWLATKKVLTVVRAEGFEIDSSSTDPKWLDEYANKLEVALPGRLEAVWPEITAESQPFFVETRAGRVLELPDTGALADYLTTDEMKAHLESALARAHEKPDRDVFVHFGFHQETAHEFGPRLERALSRVKRAHGGRLSFETMSSTAERAKQMLAK